MSISASPHLRGIVIAGGLAVCVAILGLVTLGMNRPSSSAAAPSVQVKAHTAARPSHVASVKPKAKPKVNPYFAAARAAGLPVSIANALARRPVVVVQITSASDTVDVMTAAEARAGAALAGAAFTTVSVDRNGAASALTRALGELPTAPATLVYKRPAKLVVTLTGFNDRTTVQQAAVTAAGPDATAAPAAS